MLQAGSPLVSLLQLVCETLPFMWIVNTQINGYLKVQLRCLSRIWILTDLRVFCANFVGEKCACAIFHAFCKSAWWIVWNNAWAHWSSPSLETHKCCKDTLLALSWPSNFSVSNIQTPSFWKLLGPFGALQDFKFISYLATFCGPWPWCLINHLWPTFWNKTWALWSSPS